MLLKLCFKTAPNHQHTAKKKIMIIEDSIILNCQEQGTKLWIYKETKIFDSRIYKDSLIFSMKTVSDLTENDRTNYWWGEALQIESKSSNRQCSQYCHWTKGSKKLFASITAPLSTCIKLPDRVWKPTASSPDEHSWFTVGNWHKKM